MRFSQRALVCALTSWAVVDALVPSYNSGVASLYGAPSSPPAEALNREPQQASPVLDNYEALNESSWNAQSQYQSEVVELKDELRRKESNFGVQVDKLKEELQNIRLGADRTRNFPPVTSAYESIPYESIPHNGMNDPENNQRHSFQPITSAYESIPRNGMNHPENNQRHSFQPTGSAYASTSRNGMESPVVENNIPSSFHPVGSALESVPGNGMMVPVTRNNLRANGETQEAKRAISSLLEKYQKLRESSLNAQIQYQSEVLELKDELRKKELNLYDQVNELKDELRSTQLEAERKARNLEAMSAARQAELREQMAKTVSANNERASNEVKEAKKDVSSLLQKYQSLHEFSMNQQIHHQNEVTGLKDELRKKESHFTVQVNDLKQELRDAEIEADRKARDLLAAGEAREAKLRHELELVAAENKKNENDAQEAKKEISSLLQNYQNLQSFSMNKDMQHQMEVNQLKDELRKKESEYNAQVGELKDELRNARLEKDRKVPTTGGEAELRRELELVMAENKQFQAQLDELKRHYADEIMNLEDRLEGEQDARTKQKREAERELFRVKEESRNPFNDVASENRKLQMQLDELKRRYEEESMNWGKRFESEQEARIQIQREAERELDRVKQEARNPFGGSSLKPDNGMRRDNMGGQRFGLNAADIIR